MSSESDEYLSQLTQGELNVQLRVALEENVALRKELLTSERMYRQYMTEHPPTCHNIGEWRRHFIFISGNVMTIKLTYVIFARTEAQRRVEELKEELEELRRRVKQAQSANEPPEVSSSILAMVIK